MKTTKTVAGWKGMTRAQVLELAQALRETAAVTTLPRMARQLRARATRLEGLMGR
jgi:hypothetical protein